MYWWTILKGALAEKNTVTHLHRFGHQFQLCVAVGADLRPGVGQTLPAASETNQSELESR
jgi:hypothetical protein